MITIQNLVASLGAPTVALSADLTVVAFNARAKFLLPKIEESAAANTLVPQRSFAAALADVAESGKLRTVSLKAKGALKHDLVASVTRLDLDEQTVILVTLEDRSYLRDTKAMRSDFVANVSHEIRSPLTAISGFVETLMLGAGENEADRNHFLALMKKESDRMKTLVSDLLSLSQVEAKQRREIKKTADLNQILATAFQTANSLAVQRSKTLLIEIADPLPLVPGHQDNLVRVFINLFENGINYSKDNSEIKISAEVQPASRAYPNGFIRIDVTDQGDGIPPEEIPRLTERFYRVDKSRSRDLGGTGLGLAIVKHILVRHHGKLEIQSTEGVGSTISVFLPMSPENAALS